MQKLVRPVTGGSSAEHPLLQFEENKKCRHHSYGNSMKLQRKTSFLDHLITKLMEKKMRKIRERLLKKNVD